MKAVLSLIVSMAAFSAQADIIKCSFTEPFLNVTYSMTQSKLTIQTPEGTSSVKNVSFQIKGAGNFELFDENNNVLMTLTLDGQGSDGMSDYTYPYTAEFANASTWANAGIGGCSSNFLPKSIEDGLN